MRYPDFFDAVPSIRMHDPLAGFLGAAADGIVEYRYLDAVKLAGHSCPTVAAAWQLTRRALAALYGQAVPVRGEVRVEMRGDRADGVVGVIASIATLITGASGDTGFKGIAGHFDRRNLLAYGVELPQEMRFTRTDTGTAVDTTADVGRVPGDPSMMSLLQRCVAGAATAEEAQRFGELWQARVRRVLLEHADDEAVFRVRLVAQADADSAKVARPGDIAKFHRAIGV
jgi:hypothetical protein